MNNKKKALAVFSAALFVSVVGFAVVNSEPEVTSLQAKQDERTQNQIQSLATNSPQQKSKKEKLIEEAITNQLKQATEAYKFNAQFPPYSKPLTQHNWDLLNPRAFIPRKQILSKSPEIMGSIVLDHYVVAEEDPLNVDVKFTLPEDQQSQIQGVKVSLLDANNNSSRQQSLSKASYEDGVVTYNGQLSINGLAPDGINESTIKADVTFASGEQKSLSARFKVHTTMAELQNVGDAYIDGPHLMVPVQVSTKKSGKYRIQANLFDEKTNTPVAHLNDTFTARAGSENIDLKVHASALKANGSAGPYYLSDINLSKVSTHPGEKQQFGALQKEQYAVNGFDLSIYDEDNYENPKYKDSIQFLERVSGAQ